MLSLLCLLTGCPSFPPVLGSRQLALEALLPFLPLISPLLWQCLEGRVVNSLSKEPWSHLQKYSQGDFDIENTTGGDKTFGGLQDVSVNLTTPRDSRYLRIGLIGLIRFILVFHDNKANWHPENTDPGLLLPSAHPKPYPQTLWLYSQYGAWCPDWPAGLSLSSVLMEVCFSPSSSPVYLFPCGSWTGPSSGLFQTYLPSPTRTTISSFPKVLPLIPI